MKKKLEKWEIFSNEPEKKDYTELFKPSKIKGQKMMYASSSRFRSDRELIIEALNYKAKSQLPSPIKSIDPKTIKIEDKILSRSEKAIILARKYARYHYILKSISKKNHKFLTEKQLDFVFRIVSQIKEWNND